MMSVESERTVSEFVSERMMICSKSTDEIASILGYDNPAVIRMMQEGQIKIPIPAIPSLAEVMGVDPAHLLRLAMREYMPQAWRVIESVTGGAVLTANEKQVVQHYRKVTHDRDPPAVILGGVVAILGPTGS